MKKQKLKTHHPKSRARVRKHPTTKNKDLAELLMKENILAELESDFRHAGWVGDTRNPLIIFLAMISRLLVKPVSILVKGSSGSGKTEAIILVLRFMPPEAFRLASSLSPKVLSRLGKSLSHKMLVVYEADGINDEQVRERLRPLLTEHHIIYDVLGPDRKPMQCVTEGPTGLLTSTTADRVHEETETRVISLHAEESYEHTKEIIVSQGAAAATDKDEECPIDFDLWLELQRYLASRRAKVIIPFWESVAELIGKVPQRAHRDFHRLTSLVQAHALLHRCTRARSEKGSVIADIADYRAVRKIAHTILAENFEARVREPVREVAKAIAKLHQDNKLPVTTNKLRDQLDIHRTSVSRRIAPAIALGYVRNIEPNPVKPMLLVPDKSLPENIKVLPTAEEVKKHFKAQKKTRKK